MTSTEACKDSNGVRELKIFNKINFRLYFSTLIDICRYVPYYIISYTHQFDLSSIDFFDRRFALTMETACVESVNVAPDSGAQFVNVVRYVLHNIINNIP